FVPADAAHVGLVDRIFTRVGAQDDLSAGQSTFMVEMSETANILNNATDRSLVILDEIGRGTSTYDGLSIAWAVCEYLQRLGAKTLFATHYHHLNDLAERLPGIKNYRAAVKEDGHDVIWLRKIVPGGTDRSYGIQVARLAGLPEEVLLQHLARAADHLLLLRPPRRPAGRLAGRGDLPRARGAEGAGRRPRQRPPARRHARPDHHDHPAARPLRSRRTPGRGRAAQAGRQQHDSDRGPHPPRSAPASGQRQVMDENEGVQAFGRS